jgi:Xaa-Pro aminopeptidase
MTPHPGVETALAFTPDEFARRLAAVRQAMRDRGADVVLIDEAEHLAYLTGFDRSATRYQVCAVPLLGEPVMFLRALDEPSFLERSWLTERVTYPDWEAPVEVVARGLGARGWGRRRIGLELDSNYLTVRRWQAITAALPGAEFVDFGEVLRELRLRKSPEEIAYLRRAASIADRAIEIAVAAAGEGVSERASAAAASRAFVELGADSGRAGVITSGPRSGSLHGILGDRRLARGDILHLELVPQVRGYSARIMRPTAIGAASPAQEEAARAIVEIQDDQIAAMRAGAVAADVDRIAREGILAAGLRDRYENATGYTLGYYAPWSPRTSDFTRLLVPTAKGALEPGMVFHVYASAKGLAFSETVLVTESGPERLTRSARRLFVR